jgi:C-terminal processing protease CtpA/Prc
VVSTRKIYVTTSVEKGELGIGLDLGKSRSGQGQVLRLKEFPPEAVNPASQCNPPIAVGDVIVAVNGQACDTLAESVKIIRGAVGVVQLTFEREIPL